MIKAVKGNTLIFGLSEVNIKHLQEGFPISFNLKKALDDELPNYNILIFAGKTEDDMTQIFKDAGIIHPNKTEIRDDRIKKQKL